MTLEVQMMFHVMLLAVCLVCGALTMSRDKDDSYNFLLASFGSGLFFFVPLELIYWGLFKLKKSDHQWKIKNF